MITFVVSVLVLLVVAPAALVLGCKLAWWLLKKIFIRAFNAFENWLANNGM